MSDNKGLSRKIKWRKWSRSLGILDDTAREGLTENMASGGRPGGGRGKGTQPMSEGTLGWQTCSFFGPQKFPLFL